LVLLYELIDGGRNQALHHKLCLALEDGNGKKEEFDGCFYLDTSTA